jgi:hypothetical protein
MKQDLLGLTAQWRHGSSVRVMCGDGPLVLFLHGFPDSWHPAGASFANAIRRLSESPTLG